MAPRLPDEVLFQVIRASIEPYSLSIIGDPSYHEDDEDEAVPVLYVTYSGFPDVKSLMQVDNLFYRETRSAMKEKFTGTLKIDYGRVGIISNAFLSSHTWLKSKICLISVRFYEVYPGEFKRLLSADCLPNLRQVIFTASIGIYNAGAGVIFEARAGHGRRLNGTINYELYTFELDEEKLIDVLKQRRLQLKLYAQQTEYEAEEVVVLVFKGEPGHDAKADEYKFSLQERWVLPLAELPDFMQICETHWTIPFTYKGTAQLYRNWLGEQSIQV